MTDEPNPDRPYYRVLLTRDDSISVVTMQWFDEPHYDKSRFVKDDAGEPRRWETQDEARKFVNATYRFERIHPCDRMPEHTELLKPT